MDICTTDRCAELLHALGLNEAGDPIDRLRARDLGVNLPHRSLWILKPCFASYSHLLDSWFEEDNVDQEYLFWLTDWGLFLDFQMELYLRTIGLGPQTILNDIPGITATASEVNALKGVLLLAMNCQWDGVVVASDGGKATSILGFDNDEGIEVALADENHISRVLETMKHLKASQLD